MVPGRHPGHPPGMDTTTLLRGTAGTAVALLLLVPAALVPATLIPAGEGAGIGGAGLPWDWPTGTPVPVARAFDPPEQPWLPGHRGVDLDVEVGSEVRAPADGVVVFAGTVVDRGVVSVGHGFLRSSFEPVTPLVATGEPVARGQVVATVGQGHSPGVLHWGVRTGPDAYVDPLRLLVGRVVLKPWDP